MSDALEQALEAAFAEATRRYKERGFQRRVGFGSKPALISVDLEHDDDAPPCQPVDEFSDEFLLQAPRSRRADDQNT